MLWLSWESGAESPFQFENNAIAWNGFSSLVVTNHWFFFIYQLSQFFLGESFFLSGLHDGDSQVVGDCFNCIFFFFFI